MLLTDIHSKNIENYEQLNALDIDQYMSITQKFQPLLILHLPALFSGHIISTKLEKLFQSDTFFFFCPNSVELILRHREEVYCYPFLDEQLNRRF